jgi:prophage regulatory protein
MSQHIQRRPQVSAQMGISRATLYHRIKEGLLTPPVPLGLRAVGWPSGEIDSINSARIAGKSDDGIRELVKKLVAERKLLA